MSCLIFFILTHTWGIDILLEKLTPETGGWIWETSFLHEYAFVGRDFMESQWPGGKWIDKGSRKLCMLPCHNLWDLEKQRGRVFLNLSYGGKGKSHKQEELLWGAIKKLPKKLTTELLYLELPTISASCSYALHKIPSY